MRKTAYELRISDWSSDVCSSDLAAVFLIFAAQPPAGSPSPCRDAAARRPGIPPRAADAPSRPLIQTLRMADPHTAPCLAPVHAADSPGRDAAACSLPRRTPVAGRHGRPPLPGPHPFLALHP